MIRIVTLRLRAIVHEVVHRTAYVHARAARAALPALPLSLSFYK
jgi:hypothetical protein